MCSCYCRTMSYYFLFNKFCFLCRYRADNAGKFPKVSDARKQLGGSFYVLREIIQELAHKSKMNSSNNVGEILVEEQFDKSKILTTESVNVSSSNIDVAKDSPMQDDSKSVVLDDKEAVNTCYDNLEETREPQTSYWEKRLSEEIEVVSTPVSIDIKYYFLLLLVMNILDIVLQIKQCS